MPTRSTQVRFALTLAAVIWSAGCMFRPARTTHAISSQSMAAAPAPESDLENVRGLRLFGQGSVADDIAFEGKAAVNIQQHTSASEGADFDPAVDSTGKTLVFSSTRHSKFGHLYTKSIDGSSLTQITDGNANDVQPSFSPDAKRIAFASDRAGQWDLWVTDANGRNPMQLTNSPMAELHPSWSPDGKRLAYCRINPKHSGGELWVLELDNPGAKRLIGEGLFPAWSPKEDRIAFQKARQRGSRWYSVWTITLDGNEPSPPTEVLSGSQFAFIAPTWSSDGTQLAVGCVAPLVEDESNSPLPGIDSTGQADIAIVDSDGRGMIRLTHGRGANYSPTWASDDRIYFAAKLEDSETIWSVKPFRLTVTTNSPVASPMNRQAARISERDQEP